MAHPTNRAMLDESEVHRVARYHDAIEWAFLKQGIVAIALSIP